MVGQASSQVNSVDPSGGRDRTPATLEPQRVCPRPRSSVEAPLSTAAGG